MTTAGDGSGDGSGAGGGAGSGDGGADGSGDGSGDDFRRHLVNGVQLLVLPDQPVQRLQLRPQEHELGSPA